MLIKDGRRRLLSTSKMDPKLLKVGLLHLPVFENILPLSHGAGWKKETVDSQAAKEFRFDGEMFRRSLRKGLGKEIQRIYFPAAYTGKVARSISEAGFDVWASDVSDFWVKHCKSIGLKAEKRGFEEIPQGGFDAVATFEPYTTDENVLGYLTLLRILSRNLPYMQIEEGRLEAEKEGEVRELYNAPQADTKRMVTTAYDYGAGYCNHVIGAKEAKFRIQYITPKINARKRAMLDLLLLEEQEKWPARTSIEELASIFKTSPERIAAAVFRLQYVLENRLELEKAYRALNLGQEQDFKYMLFYGVSHYVPDEQLETAPDHYIRRVTIEK